MNDLKTFPRTGVCLLMAVMLALSLTVNAQAAADMPSLDLTVRGSISVTLFEDNVNKTGAVTDGVLTLYQAAVTVSDNGDMRYLPTEDFIGCEIPGYSGGDREGAGLADPEELAEILSAWVLEKKLSGTQCPAGPDGTVRFDGLVPGMYLIVQTEASEGYYPISPFAVTLPLNSGGEWVYDIDAGPKMQPLIRIPETEEDLPDQPAEGGSDSENDELPPSDAVKTGDSSRPAAVLFAATGSLALISGVMYLSCRRDKKQAK